MKNAESIRAEGSLLSLQRALTNSITEKKSKRSLMKIKRIPYRSCSNDRIILLQNKHIKTAKIDPG